MGLGFHLLLLWVVGVGAVVPSEPEHLEANLGLVASILPGGVSLDSLTELQGKLEALKQVSDVAAQQASKAFKEDEWIQARMAEMMKTLPKGQGSFLESSSRRMHRREPPKHQPKILGSEQLFAHEKDKPEQLKAKEPATSPLPYDPRIKMIPGQGLPREQEPSPEPPRESGAGLAVHPEPLDPRGPFVAGLAVMHKMDQTPSMAVQEHRMENLNQPVVVLPARLPPIPKTLSELFRDHRPLHGQVFRPLIDESIPADKPIGSLMSEGNMGQGLEALSKSERMDDKALAAELGFPTTDPTGSTGNTHADALLRDTAPDTIFGSAAAILEAAKQGSQPLKPVLPSALDDPEAALEKLDELLQDATWNSSGNAPLTEVMEQAAAGDSPRFAERRSRARSGASAAAGTTQKGTLQPGFPSGYFPAQGSLGRLDLSTRFQLENDKDLPMGFLISQGIVAPKPAFKQKKKKGKKILEIGDEQVVTQTYAKAQTTLDRIQRTAYGMSQRVKVLNNVERELQKQLSYLGDQEFTMGGTAVG